MLLPSHLQIRTKVINNILCSCKNPIIVHRILTVMKIGVGVANVKKLCSLGKHTEQSFEEQPAKAVRN